MLLHGEVSKGEEGLSFTPDLFLVESLWESLTAGDIKRKVWKSSRLPISLQCSFNIKDKAE